MDPSLYRFLIWEVLRAIDSAKRDLVEVEQVVHHSSNGTMSQLLLTAFAGHADFSLLKEEDWRQLNDDMAKMAPGREFGIENRGICLLLAYLLEGLQAGH